MKVYLAAAFERQAEMREVRTVLVNHGYEVVSRWLDETASDTVDRIDPAPYALGDLDDIDVCDALVSFTDGEKARGGRHFETGYAYALGKPVVVVGPNEHIFHPLMPHAATVNDLLPLMAGWR